MTPKYPHRPSLSALAVRIGLVLILVGALAAMFTLEVLR